MYSGWYSEASAGQKSSSAGLRPPSPYLCQLVQEAREELNREEVERAAAGVGKWKSPGHRVQNAYTMKYTWIVFSAVHIIITALVFSHFYLKKFRVMEASVPATIPASSAVFPEEAGMAMPNYWLKRAGQPIAFAMKHAILYQLAVLPLTMCRHLITLLTKTRLAAHLPLEHMTSFHILVGYTMCGLTLLAGIIFFVYYGKGCHDHLHGAPHDPVDFCLFMRSEIYITGLLLMAGAAWMAATSYFRQYIPYEVWYASHYLAVAFYIVTVLHTLDGEFRSGTSKGKLRTQDFHYITGSVVVYVMDRMWMRMATRRAKIRKACISNDETVMLLSLEQPSGFDFDAAQFAFLQVPAVDNHWHPFTIASGPGAGTVDFYIMLVPGGWTGRVAEHIAGGGASGMQNTVVNIYGPVGSSIRSMEGFHSVSLFATGTGVAALLSAMARRYERLVMLSERMFERAASVASVATTVSEESPLVLLQLKWRLKRARALAAKATDSTKLAPGARLFSWCVRMDLVSHLFLVLDVCQAFWFVSWSILDAEGFRITPSMWHSLEVMGWTATLAFLLQRAHVAKNPAIYGRSMLMLVDVIVAGAKLGALVATSEEAGMAPTWPQMALRVVLVLWRVGRVTSSSHALRHATAHAADAEVSSLMMTRSFRGVWSTRSASCCAMVLSEIQPMFDDLVARLGADRVRSALDFVVYVTKASPEQRRNLEELLRGTVFEGMVKFERPNFKAMVLDEMKRNTAGCLHTAVQARGLSAICGNPEVGKILRNAVADANLLASALGMHQCHMDFMEENYGMVPSRRTAGPDLQLATKMRSFDELMSTRCDAGDAQDSGEGHIEVFV